MYLRYYDGGGYDMTKPASEITAMFFCVNDVYSDAMIDLLCAMGRFRTQLLLAGGRFQLTAQLLGERLQVDIRQQLLDRLRAHTGIEIVLIFFPHIAVFFFRQDLILHQRRIAGIRDDIGCKVQDLFQDPGPDAHGPHLGLRPELRHRHRRE